MSSEDKNGVERRQDVGQKMFVAILTSVLTTLFLGSLGMGIRNYEINNRQDIDLTKIGVYMKNQDILNGKLTDILEGRSRLPGVFYNKEVSR